MLKQRPKYLVNAHMIQNAGSVSFVINDKNVTHPFWNNII